MTQLSAPKTIRVTIQLLALNLVAAFFSTISCYLSYKIINVKPETYYPFSGLNLFIDAVVYFIILSTCIYQIRQGKNWARFLYVIYVATHTALNLYTHTLLGSTLIVDIFVITYLTLRVICITLLFTPESNRWFRGEEQLEPSHYEPSKKPTIVILAIQLQIINMIVFTGTYILAYFYYLSIGQSLWLASMNSAIELFIDYPLFLLVTTIILLGLSRRKSWARIVFLMYVILRLIFHFYTYNLLGYTPLIETLVAIYFILAFVSLTLLFSPISNRWFSKHE
ncbi:MAG: hypothetical protein P1U34_11115 [Coxiellaceae bacterium]|nr:hypothetical protein [Coxiellaceae bacterium]